jgi:uncharacterized membrane protein
MDIKSEALIFLISSSPVVELRGAIPLGYALGLDPLKIFLFSILGNLFPVIPLLVFFRWIIGKLERIKGIGRLLKWWFQKVEKKSKIVETAGFWGLVLFVSIPFPGTGAWTGSVAATLFNFKLRKAFIAISLGVIIAAILVSSMTLGVVKLSPYFFKQ